MVLDLSHGSDPPLMGLARAPEPSGAVRQPQGASAHPNAKEGRPGWEGPVHPRHAAVGGLVVQLDALTGGVAVQAKRSSGSREGVP